jgi:PhnB protein
MDEAGSRFQPKGRHTVTPRIVTTDPEALVAFLKRVFGAEGEFHPDRPAEMRIGDSWVMVSGEGPRDPMPAFLYVYVHDTDATFQQAMAQEATALEEPMDTPYGDRRAMVRDAWGDVWQIATRTRRGAEGGPEATV